jgi:hypothetical protein
MTLGQIAESLANYGIRFRTTKTYIVVDNPRCSVAADNTVMPRIFPVYYVESSDRVNWFIERPLGVAIQEDSFTLH